MGAVGGGEDDVFIFMDAFAEGDGSFLCLLAAEGGNAGG